jgi:hypothetical protein
MRLVEDGAVWLAVLNVLASVGAGLLAVWVGMQLREGDLKIAARGRRAVTPRARP